MHRPHHDDETPAEHLADLPIEPEMPQDDVAPDSLDDSATGIPSQPAAPK